MIRFFFVFGVYLCGIFLFGRFLGGCGDGRCIDGYIWLTLEEMGWYVSMCAFFLFSII